MTNIEKCNQIMTNPEAIKTANELLAAGNLNWIEVTNLVYMTYFEDKNN